MLRAVMAGTDTALPPEIPAGQKFRPAQPVEPEAEGTTGNGSGRQISEP
jgi:hypothetical protein